MSRLATTIWYGRFHHPEDVHSPHLLPMLAWLALLLLLTALRLVLPFVEMPTTEIHTQILQSLVSGQIWGRQALVSSIEYPPLPTLALLFAEMLSNAIRFPTPHLLVAISQVWTLFYLLRIPRGWAGRCCTGAALAVILTVNPEAREVFYRVDPNWIIAVPAACAIYHFVIWCRQRSLRDVVLVAVNCGLLIFGGAAAISLALILLLLASFRVLAWKRRQIMPAEVKGVRMLLWAPGAYAILLIFVANWLIMQNAGFFLRRCLSALATLDISPFLQGLATHLGAVSWLSLGAFGLFLLKLKSRRQRTIAVGLGASLLALLFTVSALTTLRLYAPGADILVLLLALCGILIPFYEMPQKRLFPATFGIELLIIALMIMTGALIPRPGVQPLSLDMPNAPARNEIIAAIDRYTPETRVMTYGVRAPAHYPDIVETRFLPKVDFRVKDLRFRAKSEEFLYILVPPNDGTFYTRTSALADIHEKGRPWLVLETVWPGGWQLWRVLNPAKL